MEELWGELIGNLLVFVIVIIYCFYILFFGKDKLNKRQREHRERMKKFHNTQTTNSNRHSYMYQDVEKEIIKVDHTFSKEVFLNNAKELFFKYQNSLVTEELQDLDKYATDKFINLIKDRIKYNKQNNIKVISENIFIFNAYLYEFSKSTEKQIITVKLRAELKNYEINYKTQYIEKGNEYARVTNDYEMQFVRNTKSFVCQGCGAPVNIKDLSVCEYCNTPIQVKDNEWKLNYINILKD